jgi:effector-binding domain-containing protein
VIGEVSELVVESRPTAVIASETTWTAFPALWPVLLSEVWDELRGGPARPGRNVMLYLDDAPRVEIGVEAGGPFAGTGRIVPSALPAGRVATTKLVGSYGEIGAAHQAVVDACAERGLAPLWPRWEVYGHFDETSDDQVVEIFHLVAAATPSSSAG